jgi:hypothetical protein
MEGEDLDSYDDSSVTGGSITTTALNLCTKFSEAPLSDNLGYFRCD